MEFPNYQRIYLLEDKVQCQVFVQEKKQQISLLKLDLWMTQTLTIEPAKAQRPLIEMNPHMY